MLLHVYVPGWACVWMDPTKLSPLYSIDKGNFIRACLGLLFNAFSILECRIECFSQTGMMAKAKFIFSTESARFDMQ
jgi:hypothetical protein